MTPDCQSVVTLVRVLDFEGNLKTEHVEDGEENTKGKKRQAKAKPQKSSSFQTNSRKTPKERTRKVSGEEVETRFGCAGETSIECQPENYALSLFILRQNFYSYHFSLNS
jgi:hypothetical protein